MEDLPELDKIRKLVIISLFSNDELMEYFTLKGGNALNYIYNINNRASKDIDLSMEESLKEIKKSLKEVSIILENTLKNNFKEKGYHVFDIKLEEKPENPSKNFWGGYKLEFKLLKKEKWEKLKDNKNKELEDYRRESLPLHEDGSKKFTVDISKYEYCKDRVIEELDYYMVYVYTPIMIVYEKLRAICQQLEDYQDIIPTHRTPRARDFFDIYTICQNFPLELTEKRTWKY